MTGYRKYTVTCLGLALGGLLAWYGKLDSAGVGLIVGLVTAYTTGNVLSNKGSS